MKKYIFLTFSIQRVGGGQCYTASKARFLEKEGWDVLVLSSGHPRSRRDCHIDYLNKFRDNMVLELDFPPYALPAFWVRRTLKKLLAQVGDFSVNDEIIIESHHDTLALWGEMLAKEMHARHVFFALTEHYRQKGSSYLPKIDFFMYKMDRGEILCYSVTANRLFEGFRKYGDDEIEPALLNEDPVQDVKSSVVEGLPRFDYNVCYIGRTDKPYMREIIKGVMDFAEKHTDARIQFVLVADIPPIKEYLDDIQKPANLILTELGSLHPLPRSLFSKVDVVIAGSGSARCSVENGALTIVADPDSRKALGLLGYDTGESVFNPHGCAPRPFDVALEDTLVQKKYLSQVFSYQPSKSVAECTAQNFKLIGRADPELAYYDCQKLLDGPVNVKICLKLLSCYLLER